MPFKKPPASATAPDRLALESRIRGCGPGSLFLPGAMALRGADKAEEMSGKADQRHFGCGRGATVGYFVLSDSKSELQL